VIKIASNSATYRRMTDNMDVNAGRIADGEATVPQVGQRDFRITASRPPRVIARAANGWATKNFVPWKIGPVL